MVFTLVFRLLSCVDFVVGTHATCPYCWHPCSKSFRQCETLEQEVAWVTQGLLFKGPLVSDRHSTSELSVL